MYLSSRLDKGCVETNALVLICGKETLFGKVKFLVLCNIFTLWFRLKVLEKVLWDQKSSHVISNSFALAHRGDNAFSGPVVRVVSSASNDLEVLLNREPHGLLLGGEEATLLLQLLEELEWRLLPLSGQSQLPGLADKSVWCSLDPPNACGKALRCTGSPS